MKTLLTFFCIIFTMLSHAVTMTIGNSGTSPVSINLKTDGNGNASLAWGDFATNEVKFSYKSKTGFFSNGEVIGVTTNLFRSLLAAMDTNGNVLVVWQEDQTVAYRYRPAGTNSSFTQKRTLSVPGLSSIGALEASPNGSFLMLMSTTTTVQWSERSSGASGVFSATQTLDPNSGAKGNQFSECSIAYDPSGNALVIFGNQIVNTRPTRLKYALKPNGQAFGALQSYTVPGAEFVDNFSCLYNTNSSNYWFIGWNENNQELKGLTLDSAGSVTQGPTTFYETTTILRSRDCMWRQAKNQVFLSVTESGIPPSNSTGLLSLGSINSSSFLKQVVFNQESNSISNTFASNGFGIFSTNLSLGDGTSLVGWGSQRGNLRPTIQESELGIEGNANDPEAISLIDPSAGVIALVFSSRDPLSGTGVIQVHFNFTAATLINRFGNVKTQSGLRFK